MADFPVSEATRREVARAVLRTNLHVRRGERVIIEAWTHTLPWSIALARETRGLGAYPLVLYEDEAEYWDAVDQGLVALLGAAAAHEWKALAASNVYIHLWGAGDKLRFARLPPKTQDRLFGFNAAWYATARKAKLRGARLELGRVYPSLADAYGVDEATWTDQLVRGTLVDPAQLARAAAPISRVLARGTTLRIRHPNGTDLTLGLRRYAPQPATGTVRPGTPGPAGVLVTLPSGAVRVGLDPSVAEGTFVGNRTNYYDGGVATGAVFRFERGRLVEHSFARGAELFDAGIRAGGQGWDRPGIFSIGLNPGLENTPQLEDLERGAVMVAVGGNARYGGTNRSTFFGWAITAGASVEIDGRRILE